MTDTPPTTDMTLHEVADELGVHYMTAYRYVRLGMLQASKQGKSWVVTRDDLDAFLADATPSGQRRSAPWDQRLLNRMLAPDDAGAWQVVEAALASGMAPPDVYLKVIAPALREVGERWRRGEVDVAQEHAASQIATRVIARLAPQMVHRGVKRGTIVVGSTQTDLHDLPISMVADLFRSKKFHVIDLGANLPPEFFASAVVAADDVVAAAVGVTSPGQDAEIRRTIEAIRAVSDVPILLGGGGVTKESAHDLGADAVATTGEEALVAIEELVGSA